jgi:hypothetical protein
MVIPQRLATDISWRAVIKTRPEKSITGSPSKMTQRDYYEISA